MYVRCYFLNTGMVTCGVLLLDGTMLLVTGFQFSIEWCSSRASTLPSPVFYIYIDDLITDLKLSGYGANIGNIFAGCLLYADDIVLLSPTCRGLQKLITACEQYGRLWDLKFNSLKSQLTTFGSKCPTNPIITLLNAPLYFGGKVSNHCNINVKL